MGIIVGGVAIALLIIALLSALANDDSKYFSWMLDLRFKSIMETITQETDRPLSVVAFAFFYSIFTTTAAMIALALAVVLATILTEPKVSNLAIGSVGTLAVIVAGIATKNRSEKLRAYFEEPLMLQILAVITAVAIAVAVVYLSSKIARQVLAEDPQYNLIRQIGIFLGAIGGTSFRNANLTDANFSYATLKSSNFQIANTTRTLWRQARELNYARVDDTILMDPEVRDLLVSGDGEGKNYEGANLRGANLNSANLKDANLRTADLTEASLHAACLDGANLTEVQAIGANFTWAQMTGVRLENWNIDSTTQLDDVESRYVYLLEHPKPGTDDRERRPSSGEFAPGDFTSLFQEVLNTVDLIFRDGIDWRTFMSSFKQLQVENEGTELYIQSIENKDDGVVVVKVGVPPETSKAKIHHEFMQIYEQSMKSLEEKYQAELRGKEGQLQLMLKQNASLERILLRLPDSRMLLNNPIISDRLVVIDLGPGNVEQGFAAVKAQIWSDGHSLPKNFPGKLPPQPKIPEIYQLWQGKHEHLRQLHKNQGLKFRITKKQGQVSQFSALETPQVKRDMKKLAKELEKQLDSWLNSEAFYPIQKKLRSQFTFTDRVRVIIQSEDSQVRRLPWHLWDFFQDYRSAEVALSLPEGNRIEKSVLDRERIRILAVMGDDEGIDVEKDREFLESLPDAESVFLVKPDRQELDSCLWDDRGWDILCFSGHSTSKTDGNSGRFQLGEETNIKLEELEKALIYAIGRGLQLAIFNSCDGLGLARQLENFHIPQIIVMREPVPNLVAQAFLKNFLQAYASGKTLYVAVREAREKLQGLEEKFTCASWLPVIYKNPAEFPQTWQELRGTVKPKLPELLDRLKAAIETESGLTAEDKEQALEQVNILASVGANPQDVEQRKQQNTAKWLLQGIIASRPAATQMSEALNNLLFYLNMNNHDNM